jgi:hypothetical protein
VQLRIVGGGALQDALRRHIAEVGLDERVVTNAVTLTT